MIANKKRTMKKEKKTQMEALEQLVSELERTAADFKAFATGGIGPTQQEYIDKINSNWNGYNFIVKFGHVFRLCSEKKEKPNQEGVLYSPCDLCELGDFCSKERRTTICGLLNAADDEYLRDEGELVIDKRGKMKVERW